MSADKLHVPVRENTVGVALRKLVPVALKAQKSGVIYNPNMGNVLRQYYTDSGLWGSKFINLYTRSRTGVFCVRYMRDIGLQVFCQTPEQVLNALSWPRELVSDSPCVVYRLGRNNNNKVVFKVPGDELPYDPVEYGCPGIDSFLATHGDVVGYLGVCTHQLRGAIATGTPITSFPSPVPGTLFE